MAVLAVVLVLVVAVAAALFTAFSSAASNELSVSYDRDSQVLDFRATAFTGEIVDSADLPL